MNAGVNLKRYLTVIRRWIIFLAVMLMAMGAVLAQALPLPAEQAFVLSASMHDQQTLLLHWQMPHDYYLYKIGLK